MVQESTNSSLERLRLLTESINDTARVSRSILFLLLLAALYLGLTLLSATDENLLRNSIVTLPQFQTGISLERSFLFAPPVFLLLHLYTLFLLVVLARKVRSFQTELDTVFPDHTAPEKSKFWDWLSATSFVQMYRDQSTFSRFAKLLSWSGIIAIPLLLLFLIDLSFFAFSILLYYHIPPHLLSCGSSFCLGLRSSSII